MTNIVHLKLTTGEEIIAKKYEETTNAYYLVDIRILAIQDMGNGQAGIALIPWMIGDPSGKIRIPDKFVMGEPQNSVPKSIEDAYLQQVSGLAFASGTGGGGTIQI